MSSSMRDVKCRAAASVIRALDGFDVLYVESFVLDEWHADWRHWGTQFSDDLQVLIPHGQIDDFMGRMQAKGYRPALYDQQAGACQYLEPEEAKSAIVKMPVSPEPFYVHPDWVSETGEPDLLVRFHTTRRHGRLLLADLEEWFDQREPCAVMGGAERVARPPRWAMVLWQAGEAMNHASDCAIPRDEVDKLRVVAQHLPPGDWPSVLDAAHRYSADYDRRIACPVAAQLLNAYRERLGITPGQLQKAEREYGALYELGHALEALAAYADAGGHDHVVDREMWREAASTAEQRPRKLWGYPGGQENVPEPEVLGRLGLARGPFGIHQQVENHTGADFDYLLRHRLVELLIPAEPDKPAAPPHGPWASSTAQQVDDIFAA